MPVLFKKEKPSPKKNFFQNYSDHLDFLQDKFYKKFDELMHKGNLDEAFNYISNEALERLSIFERLRDGHDYCDEFVGATAIPVLGIIASFALLGKSLYESVETLAIKIGFSTDDHQNHLRSAGFYLMLSGISFVLSIASFLKSAISMVTRPIVTGLQGWAKQDEPRFLREDSNVKKAESLVDEVVSHLPSFLM
jgi:hypothetical protein